jgi:hypothetical protein
MSATYQRLTDITVKWGAIQEENTSHRHLVTEAEWAGWEGYNKQTVATLKEILADFDANRGVLSTDLTQKLESIERAIAGVKHMDEDELLKRASDQRAEDLLKNFDS